MKVAEIGPGARFDSALRAAEWWRLDARLCLGRRRRTRLDHAERMERIAERIVEAVER